MLSFTSETDFAPGSGLAPFGTNVTAFVNGEEVYNDTLDGEVPHTIASISIGEGFTGFIEGIGIDTRLPSESDIIPRTEANFLPQCLCPADSTLTATEKFCSTTQGMNQRYSKQ